MTFVSNVGKNKSEEKERKIKKLIDKIYEYINEHKKVSVECMFKVNKYCLGMDSSYSHIEDIEVYRGENEVIDEIRIVFENDMRELYIPIPDCEIKIMKNKDGDKIYKFSFENSKIIFKFI